MGFLNKGNSKCKVSEVKEKKTLVGISVVRAYTVGRKAAKMILSSAADNEGPIWGATKGMKQFMIYESGLLGSCFW